MLFKNWTNVVLLAFAFFSFTSFPTVEAQTLLPLSDNGQFRSTLAQWNPANGNATVVNAGTDNGRLRLSGTTSVWQYVSTTGFSEFQLLNCEGFKVASSGQSGWAGIGINYYDAQWGFIDRFEKQLNISGGLDALGNAKMNPCSLGVRVPPNAVHAIIWAANDGANTTTYVDNLILFDYFKSYRLLPGPNLDGSFPTQVQDVFGLIHQLSGLQFWNLTGTIDMGTGAIGTVGTPSSIAQELSLNPGSSHIVSFASYIPRATDAPLVNFGVDYFDANWGRVGGQSATITALDFFNLSTLRVDVPSGAVHSVLWVWADALTANIPQQQFGPFYVSVDELDTTSPVVALKQPAPNRGQDDIGLQVVYSYTDNLDSYPFVDTSKVSLIGPSGPINVFISQEVIRNSENPLSKTIVLSINDFSRGFFGPIDWSLQEPGEYTLVVSPGAIIDEDQNGNTNQISTSFQLIPALFR